jgi:hypothetical protein
VEGGATQLEGVAFKALEEFPEAFSGLGFETKDLSKKVAEKRMDKRVEEEFAKSDLGVLVKLDAQGDPIKATRVAVDKNDRERINRLAYAGYVPAGRPTGSLEEIGLGGLPGKRGREEAAELAATAAGNLANIAAVNLTADSIIEGATGLSGLIVENIAGPVGQLNKSVGDNISQIVANADVEEITSFITKARSIIAKSVPTVVGEESGRITREELRITERTTKLADTMASFPQAKAALGSLVHLNALTLDRHRAEAGLPRRFELSTVDGRLRMAERLENFGLKSREIVDTINSLIAQREELAALGLQ